MIAPAGADMEVVRADWAKDMKDRVVFPPDVIAECADACRQGLPLWVVTEVQDTPLVREQESNAVLQRVVDDLLQDPLATSSGAPTQGSAAATPPAKGQRKARRSPSPPPGKGKASKKAKKETKKQEESDESSESSDDARPTRKATPPPRPLRSSPGLKKPDTKAGSDLAARLASKEGKTPKKK
jgi:hypothetical protein